MLFRGFVSLLTLTALTACGSGGSGTGEKLSPLSPEQKDKVQNVTESMEATQGAAAQGRGGAGLNGMFQKQVAFSKGARSEKSRELGLKLQQAQCTFDNTLPTNGTPSNGSFHLNVGGPNCPIRMVMSQSYVTKFSETSMDMRNEQSISYAVGAPEYMRLNDVTGIDFKGAMTTHMDQNGGNVGGRFEGAILSQQYGKLPLLMTAGGSSNKDGGTFTMTLAMTFPDFTAVGKMVNEASRDGNKISYFVNDQEVSKKEFEDVFGATSSQN